jgi:hypothetical protein
LSLEYSHLPRSSQLLPLTSAPDEAKGENEVALLEMEGKSFSNLLDSVSTQLNEDILQLKPEVAAIQAEGEMLRSVNPAEPNIRHIQDEVTRRLC